MHEGVDLEGEAGDCVFAAYIGRVVEVEYRDSVFFGPHRIPVSVHLA